MKCPKTGSEKIFWESEGSPRVPGRGDEAGRMAYFATLLAGFCGTASLALTVPRST